MITNRNNIEHFVSKASGNVGTNYIFCAYSDGVDDFETLQDASGYISVDRSINSWCVVQAKSEGIPTVIGIDAAPLSLKDMDDQLGRKAANADGLDFFLPEQGKRTRLYDGETLTIDGTTGAIYRGQCTTSRAPLALVFDLIAKVLTDCLNTNPDGFSYNAVLQSGLYHDTRNQIKALIKSSGIEATLGKVDTGKPSQIPAVAGTAHTVEGVIKACLVGTRIGWDDERDELSIQPAHKALCGIGLLRTERLFRSQRALDALRVIILGQDAFNDVERTRAYRDYADFIEAEYFKLLTACRGRLSVVRTLCMPNNKLFPNYQENTAFAARQDKNECQVLDAITANIHESESFHGLRGTRLHMIDPELAKRELSGYLRAISRVRVRDKAQRFVLLMSMVTFASEARIFSEWLSEVAARLTADGFDVPFVELAVMVETANAFFQIESFTTIANKSCALTGFFFGGNDFTAATLNMDRTDSSKVLIPKYHAIGLFKQDPFVHLDEAVIQVIASGTRRIKAVLGDRALIGFGGEQAADYNSIRALARESAGRINFVSTSPDRVLEHTIRNAYS